MNGGGIPPPRPPRIPPPTKAPGGGGRPLNLRKFTGEKLIACNRIREDDITQRRLGLLLPWEERI